MTTLTEVHNFLLGEAPLDGVNFGDKHPTRIGHFWWRYELREAIAQEQVNQVSSRPLKRFDSPIYKSVIEDSMGGRI